MIKECRACSSKNLTNIISLGNLYLAYFIKNDKKPPRYPLLLVLCGNCTLLQLKYTVPPSLLYTDQYGYKSGINRTMQKELKEITEKSLLKISKSKDKIVAIDIGANDGTLLKNYPKQIKRIGIEPIRKFSIECKKNANIVINDFFNYQIFKEKAGNIKSDIITAISCFYDIDNPNKFLHDIKKILHENGVFVIQQNYLVAMLQKNAFDNIVHEHLEYYSLLSLENLLRKHDLEIFYVELSNINGGSFRTYISHKGKRPISNTVEKLRISEKKLNLRDKNLYIDFVKNIKENKKKLYDFIKKEVKKGKTIYVYGASTRGNTLLQYFKLNKKLIPYAVERNPEKWGKKITSLGIPIISEDQARKNPPDYMLVLPWFFKEEFLEREKKYLKKGGHFIFPLPRFEIV